MRARMCMCVHAHVRACVCVCKNACANRLICSATIESMVFCDTTYLDRSEFDKACLSILSTLSTPDSQSVPAHAQPAVQRSRCAGVRHYRVRMCARACLLRSRRPALRCWPRRR